MNLRVQSVQNETQPVRIFSRNLRILFQRERNSSFINVFRKNIQDIYKFSLQKSQNEVTK